MQKLRKMSDMTQLFQNLDTWAFFYFLKFLLNEFNKFNAYFQSNLFRAHKILPHCDIILKTFVQNFIRQDLHAQFFQIDYFDLNNYAPIDLINLGEECQNFFDRYPAHFNIPKIRRLKAAYTNFYANACHQIRTRFYVNSEVYKAFTFMDTKVLFSENAQVRTDVFESVVRICQGHYNFINVDKLITEYFDVLDLATPENKEIFRNNDIEIFWKVLFQAKNDNNEYLFPQMCALAEIIMSFPNSNAESERRFSDMKDLRHFKRNRMNNDLLSAIIVLKSALRARKETVSTFRVTPAHLQKYNNLFNKRGR